MSASSNPPPDQGDYLEQVAGSAHGRRYKAKLIAELEIRPGDTVLDLGCGPGADLAALAASAAPGTVIGVDHDHVLLSRAHDQMIRSRLPGRVLCCRADLARLPLAAGSADRARIDRVLMHLPDVAAVLAQVVRVLRPGGWLTLAEPDWTSLHIASADAATSQAFTGYVCAERIRNPAAGAQLSTWARAAGLRVLQHRMLPQVFTGREDAEDILGITRVTRGAVAAGWIASAVARRWLAELASEPFHAQVTLGTVLAEAARGADEKPGELASTTLAE